MPMYIYIKCKLELIKHIENLTLATKNNSNSLLQNIFNHWRFFFERGKMASNRHSTSMSRSRSLILHITNDSCLRLFCICTSFVLVMYFGKVIHVERLRDNTFTHT